MGDSVSFDSAAEIYDRTRVTDARALGATIDLLERELDGRAAVLEVGVGTGALAVPLAERGGRVVGADLSPAMLAQLRTKSATLPVVAADATELPFRDAAFGGAFARWVLHLIPGWRRVVDEVCRVVRAGGVVAIEPGGYRGDWLEVWRRIERELGPAVRHVGLDVRNDDLTALDGAFARHGAVPRALPPVRAVTTSTLGRFFAQARERAFSWTWRVDEHELDAALDRVEAWARQRYDGDLSTVADDVEMRWRAYDLP